MPSYQILPQIDFLNNNALKTIQNRDLCLQILELNETTAEYGVVLSERDAADLVQTRNKSLRDNDRIEMGIGVLPNIIEKFSRSSFVNQSNYAETLNDLLDLFYYIKSESRDEISDNDLVDRLYNDYENKYFGSMDLMNGRVFDLLQNKEDDYGTEPPEMEEED